jgi:hypothetical protein
LPLFVTLFIASAVSFNILTILVWFGLVWFGTAGHYFVFYEGSVQLYRRTKLSAQQAAVQINSGGKG